MQIDYWSEQYNVEWLIERIDAMRYWVMENVSCSHGVLSNRGDSQYALATQRLNGRAESTLKLSYRPDVVEVESGPGWSIWVCGSFYETKHSYSLHVQIDEVVHAVAFRLLFS
jgi:hypothetical protein